MRTALVQSAAAGIPARKVRPGYRGLFVNMNSYGESVYLGAVGGPMQTNSFFGSFKAYEGTQYAGQNWQYYQTGAALATLQAFLAANAPYVAVVAFETTNSVFNSGFTAAQCLAYITSWAAIIRAACPSAVILVMGSPPRCTTASFASGQPALTTYGSGDAGIAAANQAMFNVDAALIANPTLYGIDKCLNIRQASINGVALPFGFMDNNGTGTVIATPSGGWPAYFVTNAAPYDSNATGSQVHPSTAASTLLVNALQFTFQGMQ